MKIQVHKSCSCKACKAGSKTKSGKKIKKNTQKILRRHLKKEIQIFILTGENNIGCPIIGTPYMD
jgi:hypothetical protein